MFITSIKSLISSHYSYY